MQDRSPSWAFGLFVVAVICLAFATVPATAASSGRLTPNRDVPNPAVRLAKTAADWSAGESERAAVERALAEQLLRSRPQTKPEGHETAPAADLPRAADQSQVSDWLRTGRPAAQSCDDILVRAQLGELGADDFGALRRCR